MYYSSLNTTGISHLKVNRAVRYTEKNCTFVKPYLASVLFCVEISNYAKSDMIFYTLLTFMFQYSDFISFQKNIITFLRTFVEKNVTLLVCTMLKINYKGKRNRPCLTDKFHILHKHLGCAVAQLVEALRYKPKGRGFNSPQCHWNFALT